MKRILCIAAALILALFSFVSCSGEKVMQYGGTAITKGQYEYLYSSLKNFYLETYSDIEDKDEGWDKHLTDTQTYAGYIDEEIKKTIRQFVISAGVFDEKGYTVTQSAQSAIEDTLDDVIESFGGRGAMLSELSRFNMDEKDLMDVYTIQYKYESLLYERGISTGDETDVERYYNDHYACAKIIYISLNAGYVTDDDGTKIIDSDGYYQMRQLSDEEKAERQERLASLQDALNNNADDFDDYYTDSKTNDLDVSCYPRGLFFCSDDPYMTGLTAVADVIFTLDEGEWTTVTDDNGAYVVKREVLPERAYEDDIDSVQFAGLDEYCARARFDEIIEKYADKLRTNDDAISSFGVKNVSAVSY